MDFEYSFGDEVCNMLHDLPDKWLGPWGKIVHDAVGLDHSKLLYLRLSTDYWL